MWRYPKLRNVMRFALLLGMALFIVVGPLWLAWVLASLFWIDWGLERWAAPS